MAESKSESTSRPSTADAVPLRPASPIDADISKARPKGEMEETEPGVYKKPNHQERHKKPDAA